MKLASTTLTHFLLSICLLLPLVAVADEHTILKAIDKTIRLRDYDQAVKLLQPLLKKNSAEAQYRMAGLYRSGSGVPKDLDKALSEYHKASLSGLDKAQFALASLLEKQGFSNKKMIEIKKWFQAAADQGHRKARKKLAALEKRIANNSAATVSHETIFSAIRNNDLDQINSLIEQQVNMDFKDANLRTPLMVALLAKHHEMSQLLLPHSSQLDDMDINNNRALHLASSNSYADIVLTLIQQQVDINASDGLGNTALIIATRHDDKEILRHLLDNHADPSIKNKKSQTAPQLVQTLDLKNARTLFKEFNIELPVKNKDYAEVDIKSFRASIAKSSSLYKGWPLLNIASLLGESAIVAQLLDQAVPINDTDSKGNSALHRAASKGQIKTLKLLISRGININAINHQQQTALYVAASTGKLKAVTYLVKNGADTSLIAKNKTSALSIAISNKHVKAAESLISKKLSKPAIHQALLVALLNNMESLSVQLIKRDELLLFSYTKNRSALWHSANLGLMKATTELLHRNRIDIDLPDKDGFTALARSINNGFSDIAGLLITSGANINTVTHEKNSMLMLAVLSKQPATFKKILKLDKNLNAKNNSGNTALMLAASNGNKEFVELLIKSGADIQTRNQDDLNAYQMAINASHPSIAELIKENSGQLFKLFN